MRRDMELVRKIILTIDDAPTGFAPDDMSFEGYTDEQVGYHQHLIIDAGLAEGADVTHTGSTCPEAMISSLTSAGHDFADQARNDTLWRKAVAFVKEKGVTATVAIMHQVLIAQAKKSLGLE